MPFTVQCFASKLRDLRASFGSTLEEVAAATGISADRLAALEAARDEPTGDEVLVLSDHFGCDFGWLIDDDALNEDENLRLLFRATGDEFSVADRHAIKEFVHLCKSQALLEQLLNVPPSKIGFKFVPKHKYYVHDGQLCAKSLREWFGFETRAIVHDVYGWFRKLGMRVFRRNLSASSISGLFIHHPHAGRCILVNFAEDLYRQRFSAAHECGHALMDAGRPFNVSQEADQRSNDLRELRANVFASDFLMPPGLLRAMGNADEWKDPAKIVDAADKLWVSVPALLSALKRAKLLDEETRESLRSMKLRPPEKREPELSGALAPRQRARKEQLLALGLHTEYVHLCFEAYAQDLITQGKLAETLLVDISELPEIASLFGSTLHYG